MKKIAWNKITPDEEDAILKAAKDESLSDFRAAELMRLSDNSISRHFLSKITVSELLLPFNILIFFGKIAYAIH